MFNPVFTEKPKGLLIREIAESMKKVRSECGDILIVPVLGLVHTAASHYLVGEPH